MRLESIKLQNIRSYINQTIEFPQGSVLLAGDIGSGKSTILLAIEFGLFGLVHGSGASLLRAGKNEGSVELKFSVDKKEIIVKRCLKRSKDSVGQLSGFIIIDGLKKEGMPSELKSDIIDLLGYPKEIISKSKNLIFRYTVYTPQEEMKQILSEDKEIRVETLRRVFGIDKYKRIRENALIYSKDIGVKSRLLDGKIADLEEKQVQFAALQSKIEGNSAKLLHLLPALESKRKELENQKSRISAMEEDSRKKIGLENQVRLQDALINLKLGQREKDQKEIVLLGEQLVVLEKELANFERLQGAIPDLDKLSKQISQKESDWKVYLQRSSQLTAELNQSSSLQQKITTMTKCPVCLQDVTVAHKHEISSRETEIATSLKKQITDQKLLEEASKKELDNLRQQLDVQKKQVNDQEILKIRKRTLDEKRKRFSDLEASQLSLKTEIGAINSKKLELQKELKALDLSAFDSLKRDLEKFAAEEKQLTVDYAKLEKELEQQKLQQKLVQSEIDERLKSKKQLEHYKRIRFWLEEHFINLMSAMERQVMSEVYAEFNALFQQWFRMLIDDEILSLRLDEEFSPVIQQNGYEVELDSLSGGEKTSVALAYRLSLNRVINDIISGIKTKDIIILDEPTDGFSTEQLDRLRDIIDELKVPQVILVSHESKIEGFVDKVIRLTKNEHITSVVNSN